MSHDAKTLSVYDAKAQDYARMVGEDDTPGLEAFVSALPENATVLDLGCGPGHCALVFQAAGVTVDAVDGSQAMVDHARAQGVPARLARFEEIDAEDGYDGIWANFSLLHAPKSALPGILSDLYRAIRSGGVFHIGTKLGDGEARDKIGRFYAYYKEEELVQLLTHAGFTPFATQTGAGTGLDGSVSDWIVVRAHG
ncbi:class I SAM-dependent methyltransferase [Aliiroseovarius subalbicans]|uniref:class I SAM-dependent DNA methyltransferase n=1 Tax=Aliiroseovarius subalbicans TaxID=2925840 RepID=UPI001F5A56FF|nr:class I SAM-dependent methyltransferase [Aliiroseovarius subalbicans]MCI2399734.1 class I SAM-dependent methyltransferase [Aliiroseovarius subalbicans]